MQATTNLSKYIKKQKNLDEIKKLLKENSLFYNIGNLFCDFVEEDYEVIDNNRKIALMYEYEIVKLCRLFSNKNIHPIIFKGLFLSRIIYGSIFERVCNDLDIYVQTNQFDQSLELLLSNGYRLRCEEELTRQHHVVLIKENAIVLELHKNIYHPMIGIKETFLKTETRDWDFGGYILTSFSITGTFLHLLYHLYMDTWLTKVNLYSFLKDREFPQANRFLYRAYEIALFAEKYNNEINWEDILKDIKTQKFRICFKKMIRDILDIFPNVFPDSFVELIFHLDYVDDERDQLYKYLIEQNNNSDTDGLLCNYINENWDKSRETNMCIKIGEPISLTQKSTAPEKGSVKCNIKIDKINDDLVVTFKVSTRDFYISGLDEFHTLSSDGIHLLLCGTNVYSYNSIFLFPKENNGSYKVIACDVLRKPYAILDDTTIKTDFTKTEDGYVLTAILSSKFLSENHLDPYFYMNVIIPDCNPETRERRCQLMLTQDDSQWYNPMFFAKIYMNKNFADENNRLY